MPSERDTALASLRAEAETRTRAAEGALAWARAERIYGLARRLARAEEADRFVVGAAALLHPLPMPDVLRALDVAGVPEEPRRAIGAALVALTEPGRRGDPLDQMLLANLRCAPCCVGKVTPPGRVERTRRRASARVGARRAMPPRGGS